MVGPRRDGAAGAASAGREAAPGLLGASAPGVCRKASSGRVGRGGGRPACRMGEELAAAGVGLRSGWSAANLAVWARDACRVGWEGGSWAGSVSAGGFGPGVGWLSARAAILRARRAAAGQAEVTAVPADGLSVSLTAGVMAAWDRVG